MTIVRIALTMVGASVRVFNEKGLSTIVKLLINKDNYDGSSGPLPRTQQITRGS